MNVFLSKNQQLYTPVDLEKPDVASPCEKLAVSIVVFIAATYLAISCLLYTSPSPRDRTRSRMPSSA